MALSLAKAAPLKPEIKLAQALSEFEAVLANDQKTQLRVYRGQQPPNPTDVMRFTAELDRDAGRNRKSRQCVGTRLTNVLNAIQQFSTVVDFIVGSSQSQIASAIWGAVKISLQLASSISSYFEQLSTLFMKIGRTCPRYQDFGLLYPESTRLQGALCEYFVVIVHLCKQAVLFLKKPFWSQISSSILKPFESEFGGFYRDLESLASAIRDEVSLASNQTQQNEATEMSKFRAFVQKISESSTQDLAEARTRKREKAKLLFLNTCSVYNHEKSWKQMRKKGNADWICHDEDYKLWKQEDVSSALWCTGILGSGKSVLSATVVEDLKITTTAIVAYFFCRHDEVESLQTRTIIGSIARQLFAHKKPNMIDAIGEIRSSTIDTDEVVDYLQRLLPSNPQKYIIIIDGLDECEEEETRSVLLCLKKLLTSKQVFRVYCSSRPDIFRWTRKLLEPKWNISMSQTGVAIEEYVKDSLERHLESETLCIGDPTVILTIQDALLGNAHGMFLWVSFQIDSICSQKTDAAILTALEDLPKDLPDTFNRVLRKLQRSNTTDPHFRKRIFDLLAAAQRPLTLEELREAVSIEPCETKWDASKRVNEMLKLLLDSCGSLVAVDEEHLTVHFAHHSVKQHLLSKPTDLDIKSYHVDMKDADIYLGDITVTYLNLGIFDRQLIKASSTVQPPRVNYPSAILGDISGSSFANRLAVRLLKNRRNSEFDIRSQLRAAAGIVDESKEQNQVAHAFLSYAQEYWLFHTKAFTEERVSYTLWLRLIDGKVNTVKLPLEWTLHEAERINMIERMRWSTHNEHSALINRIVEKITWGQQYHEAARPLFEFLENKKTKTNVQNIDFDATLYMASVLNEKACVLLSLRHGANINANYQGEFSSALQAASVSGHEEIVRILLENGANVNTTEGYHDTALQAASLLGHDKIARLLLESGAHVNAEGGIHGSALQAALVCGHEETARILLENGADVHYSPGIGYDIPLETAVRCGRKAIVRLLLDKGAEVTYKALSKASKYYPEIEEMLRNAQNLQRQELHNMRPSSEG